VRMIAHTLALLALAALVSGQASPADRVRGSRLVSGSGGACFLFFVFFSVGVLSPSAFLSPSVLTHRHSIPAQT
jgi:hypothetical protein